MYFVNIQRRVNTRRYILYKEKYIYIYIYIEIKTAIYFENIQRRVKTRRYILYIYIYIFIYQMCLLFFEYLQNKIKLFLFLSSQDQVIKSCYYDI